MYEDIKNRVINIPGLVWSRIFPAGLQFNNLARHIFKVSAALILSVCMFPVMHHPAHVYAAGGCSDPNNTSNVCVYLRQMQEDGKIASEEKDTFLNILFDDDAPTDAFYNLGYQKGENFKNNILYKVSKGIGDEIGGWHDSLSGKDFNIWNCIASFGNSSACDLPASAYYDSGNRNYYVNAKGDTTNNTTYQNVINNNQKTITYYNTTNNTWETNNYNNYYYDLSTHVTQYYNTENNFYYTVDNSLNYTKVAIYDNSGLREQYNHYFKLPNGDNSLNYDANTIRGYKLDYNVSNYARYVMPSDLIHLWHFNGDLTDELHLNNLFSAPTNYSYVHSDNDFDTYITAGNNNVAFWVDGLGDNGTYSFRFMTDDTSFVFIRSDNSDDPIGVTSAFNEGSWHQLDFVMNNGVGTVYFDGKKYTTKKLGYYENLVTGGISKSETRPHYSGSAVTGQDTTYTYNKDVASRYMGYASSEVEKDVSDILRNGFIVNIHPRLYWVSGTGVVLHNAYIDEVAVYNKAIYSDHHDVKVQPIDSGVGYILPDVDTNNRVLVQSIYPVNNYQFGGVRNPSPQQGDVYFSVNDNGFVTSSQIWNGYNWRSVKASVYDADSVMWRDIIGTCIKNNSIDTQVVDTSIKVSDANLTFFERWFNKFEVGINTITEAIKNINFAGGSTTNNIYDSQYVTNNYTDIENNYNQILVPGADAQQTFNENRNELKQRIGIFGQASDLLEETISSVKDKEDNEKIFEWENITFDNVVIIRECKLIRVS